MGGLWAQERDISQVTVKARNFSLKMSQKWRLVLDLTYPYTSMMTGFGFNSIIEEQFGEVNIEDLWLPYFTITTDISISDMKIHDSGCLWRYVRRGSVEVNVRVNWVFLGPRCLLLATCRLSVTPQTAISY